MGDLAFRAIGPAVRDGVLRYVSISQMESFDPSTYGGCERRWWFRRVARAAEPQGTPAALGEQVHAQIERYLSTGDAAGLGDVARSGMRFFPRPGPDLRVEWAFGACDGDGVISPLHLAGVSLIGKVDLAHARGEWVDDDGEVRPEPGGVEVVDWKTTARVHDEEGGRRGLAKTAEALAATWQMRSYAELAVTQWPQATTVRLSHGYMQSRWPRVSVKRSLAVAASGVSARFHEGDALVARMVAAAGVRDVRELPANLASCGAYGGCPHRDRCPRDTMSVLASLFRDGKVKITTEEVPRMSLLEKRKAEAAAKSAGAAVDGAAVAPPDVAPPRDIAKIEISPPAPITAASGRCPAGGAQVKLVDDGPMHACECGAVVKTRPKKLADGNSYALMPEHDVGQVPSKPKKKFVRPAAIDEPADVLDLYLDCAEDGVAASRLETYADAVAADLAREEGAVDVRCAPEKSALAFGKWRGALAAAVRAAPPAPGAWVVSSGSELGMVAFEALAAGAARVVRKA